MEVREQALRDWPSPARAPRRSSDRVGLGEQVEDRRAPPRSGPRSTARCSSSVRSCESAISRRRYSSMLRLPALYSAMSSSIRSTSSWRVGLRCAADDRPLAQAGRRAGRSRTACGRRTGPRGRRSRSATGRSAGRGRRLRRRPGSRTPRRRPSGRAARRRRRRRPSMSGRSPRRGRAMPLGEHPDHGDGRLLGGGDRVGEHGLEQLAGLPRRRRGTRPAPRRRRAAPRPRRRAAR